ncbi:hypothetical protein A3F37_00760 [Candidatus Saccharibacteria bacterium RIFCSPHIGHO2_12_FULL_41_12]|nr:MAG: hypothetical protein A3F37_00760 [Candidatus Saccharibacteria bacterium RIFCSPHIGHO2_12_FULL_41_12]
MSETRPKVAYIIIGYNNEDLLAECFDSILSQTHQNNWILFIDNMSSDNSVKFVKEHYPETTIIEPGKNTGFAKGNNIGIARALEDEQVGYIVLLNTDARLDKNWTEKITTFAKKKPKGAFFQGTTLDYYDHEVIDSTHIFVSHNGQGTQGNWRYYVTDEKGPKKIFGVNAAACMISRKFIEAQPFGAKLFDETLFMYLEDIDLAVRSTMMGWDNYLVPRAQAYHMGSVSSGKNPDFSLYMTFRNNSAILFKNFPLIMLTKMLPNIVRGDIDTIRTLRRIGKKGASYKVVKGRFVGILRLPLFLQKRLKLRKYYRSMNKNYVWQLMRKGY